MPVKNCKNLNPNATDLECKIFKNSRGGQKYIHSFIQKEYYRDLGHDSFKEWAVKNQSQLGRSYHSLMRDYHSACITVDIKGQDSIGEFTPFSLMPMKDLTAEERQSIYDHISSELGEEELTTEELSLKAVLSAMVDLSLDIPRNYQKGDDLTSNLISGDSTNQHESSNTQSVESENISNPVQETQTSILGNKPEAENTGDKEAESELSSLSNSSRKSEVNLSAKHFDFYAEKKIEVDFFNCFYPSYEELPLSKNLAGAIDLSFSEKTKLRIARYLIEELNEPDLERAVKEIKNYRKLIKNR